MPCRLLLVSGSLRSSSTTTAVVRTAQKAAPAGADVDVYDGLDRLPHFNADDDIDPLPPEVARLRAAIHAADGLLFCTPEYAGALPGSVKNLLEWTIGDDRPGSIYTKPVAWINASPRGARGAHAELRTVLSYAHAEIVDGACVDIPVTPHMLDDDGFVVEPGCRDRIGSAIADFVALACPSTAA